MANNKKILALLSMMLVLGMSACAHKSKVQPSKGHIDAQNIEKAKPVASIPKPVTNNTYLPPPIPKAKEQVYSIVVYDTPVKEVLFAIARDSKLNVDIHPAIQGRVTLNAVDQTLPAILERLSKQVDLTYKLQNNVLSIVPDSPSLRTYKVDYVNVARTSSGSISAASEISSTGQGADVGGSSGGGSSGGGNNSSRASVTDESKNHFWENLEKNLKEILAETDKEVIITRATDTASKQAANKEQAAKKGDSASDKVAVESANNQDSQKALTEYKTLFAAQVIVNKEAGIVSIRATNKQHEKVQEFLDKVLGSVKRQVLIEATIVEVQLKDTYQFGINWTQVSGNFTFSQLFAPSITPGGSSNPAIIGFTNDNITASIRALEQFGNAQVLSSPKMMAINNQPAILKVVDNLVYFTVEQDVAAGNTNSNSSVATTSTPHTIPVGLVMSMTPQISDTGEVTLLVRPTISRLVNSVRDPVNLLNFIPEIRVQEMESVLKVSSGQTAVLGGLMQDVVTTNTQGVPGLSKIPYAGRLFESNDDRNVKTELVIFLRPTVITSASLESDELATYKQYLPSDQLKTNPVTDSER